MKIIESYLPVFQGFYGSIFEYENEEQDIENHNEENGTDLNFNDFEWDYKDYHKRVSEACVSSLWNYLKLDGFEIDIQFDKLYSPREYNFSNDVIYCTYKVSDEDLQKLIDYCKDNNKEFTEYLEEGYSSRPGFISFFDTDKETWFSEYLKEDSDKFSKAFVGILEFYLNNEGYRADDMYSDCSNETSYINYELLSEIETV